MLSWEDGPQPTGLGPGILGFIVGLYLTVQGGDAIDLAFHATMLPLLLLTLLALLRKPTPFVGARRSR